MEFAEFIKVPVVHKVTLVRPGYSRLDGTLCITGHHLMFSSRIQASEELMVRWISLYIMILLLNCFQSL